MITTFNILLYIINIFLCPWFSLHHVSEYVSLQDLFRAWWSHCVPLVDSWRGRGRRILVVMVTAPWRSWLLVPIVSHAIWTHKEKCSGHHQPTHHHHHHTHATHTRVTIRPRQILNTFIFCTVVLRVPQQIEQPLHSMLMVPYTLTRIKITHICPCTDWVLSCLRCSDLKFYWDT